MKNFLLFLWVSVAFPSYANFDATFKKNFPDIAANARFTKLGAEEQCAILENALKSPDLSEQQRIDIINQRVLLLLSNKKFNYKKQLIESVGLETIVRLGDAGDANKNILWLHNLSSEKGFEIFIPLVEKDEVLCQKILSWVSPQDVVKIFFHFGLENLLTKYKETISNFIVSIKFPWHCVEDLGDKNCSFLAKHLTQSRLSVKKILGHSAQYGKSFITDFLCFLLERTSTSEFQNTIFPYSKSFFSRDNFDSLYFGNSSKRTEKFWNLVNIEPELLKILISKEEFENSYSQSCLLSLVIKNCSFEYIRKYAETEFVDCLKRINSVSFFYKERIIESTLNVLFSKDYNNAVEFIKNNADFREIVFKLSYALRTDILSKNPEILSILSVHDLLENVCAYSIENEVKHNLLSRKESEILDFFKSLNKKEERFSTLVLEKILNLFPTLVKEKFHLKSYCSHDYLKLSGNLFGGAQKLLIENCGIEILDSICPEALIQFFSYTQASEISFGKKLVDKFECIIKNWLSSLDNGNQYKEIFLNGIQKNKNFLFNICRNVPEFVKLHWDWDMCFEKVDLGIVKVLGDGRFTALTNDLISKLPMSSISDSLKEKLVKVFSLERLLEFNDFDVSHDFALKLKKNRLLSSRESFNVMKMIQKPINWTGLEEALKNNIGHSEGIQGQNIQSALEPLSRLFLNFIPSDLEQNFYLKQAINLTKVWIKYVEKKFSWNDISWKNGLIYIDIVKNKNLQNHILSIGQIFSVVVAVAERTVQENILLKALTDVFTFPDSTQNFLGIPTVSYKRLNAVFDLKPYEFVEAGESQLLKRRNKERLAQFMEDLNAGVLPINAHGGKSDGYIAFVHNAGYKITERIRDEIKFPVNFVTKEDIDNPYHPIKTVLRLCESVILDGNGYSVSPNRFPQARCANGVYVDCFLSIASMMGHGQHLSGLLFKDLDCGQ